MDSDGYRDDSMIVLGLIVETNIFWSYDELSSNPPIIASNSSVRKRFGKIYPVREFQISPLWIASLLNLVERVGKSKEQVNGPPST